MTRQTGGNRVWVVVVEPKLVSCLLPTALQYRAKQNMRTDHATASNDKLSTDTGTDLCITECVGEILLKVVLDWRATFKRPSSRSSASPRSRL